MSSRAIPEQTLDDYFQPLATLPDEHVLWFNISCSFQQALSNFCEEMLASADEMQRIALQMMISLRSKIACPLRCLLLVLLAQSARIGPLEDFLKNAPRCRSCRGHERWPEVVEHFSPKDFPKFTRPYLLPLLQAAFRDCCQFESSIWFHLHSLPAFEDLGDSEPDAPAYYNMSSNEARSTERKFFVSEAKRFTKARLHRVVEWFTRCVPWEHGRRWWDFLAMDAHEARALTEPRESPRIPPDVFESFICVQLSLRCAQKWEQGNRSPLQLAADLFDGLTLEYASAARDVRHPCQTHGYPSVFVDRRPSQQYRCRLALGPEFQFVCHLERELLYYLFWNNPEGHESRDA